MKKHLFIRFSVLITYLFVLFSCTSELGLNENNNLEPFFEIKDVFNETIPINVTGISSTPPNPLSKIFPFQIVNNTTVKKNLRKVVFHLTMTNNTSSTIGVYLDFLHNNLSLRTVNLSINSNDSIKQDVFFESQTEIENFKRINQLQITLPTSFTSGSISVKCDATVYLKL